MANAISSTGNFVHSLRSTPKRGAFAKRHVGEGVGGKAISGDSFQISGVWGSKRLPEPEAFSNPRTGDVISESGRVRATELLSLMHNYRYAVGPRPDKQHRHVNPDVDVEQQQDSARRAASGFEEAAGRNEGGSEGNGSEVWDPYADEEDRIGARARYTQQLDWEALHNIRMKGDIVPGQAGHRGSTIGFMGSAGRGTELAMLLSQHDLLAGMRDRDGAEGEEGATDQDRDTDAATGGGGPTPPRSEGGRGSGRSPLTPSPGLGARDVEEWGDDSATGDDRSSPGGGGGSRGGGSRGGGGLTNIERYERRYRRQFGDEQDRRELARLEAVRWAGGDGDGAPGGGGGRGGRRTPASSSAGGSSRRGGGRGGDRSAFRKKWRTASQVAHAERTVGGTRSLRHARRDGESAPPPEPGTRPAAKPTRARRTKKHKTPQQLARLSEREQKRGERKYRHARELEDELLECEAELAASKRAFEDVKGALENTRAELKARRRELKDTNSKAGTLLRMVKDLMHHVVKMESRAPGGGGPSPVTPEFREEMEKGLEEPIDIFFGGLTADEHAARAAVQHADGGASPPSAAGGVGDDPAAQQSATIGRDMQAYVRARMEAIDVLMPEWSAAFDDLQNQNEELQHMLGGSEE